MAERLTESEVSKSFTEQELRTSEQARIYQKLGKLEDILEKYDLEVEELDERIHNGAFNYIDKLKAENERDTWQKACELACKHIAEVEWLSCPETDDIKESENEIKTLTKQSLNYFYQQAKTEGNDEK